MRTVFFRNYVRVYDESYGNDITRCINDNLIKEFKIKNSTGDVLINVEILNGYYIIMFSIIILKIIFKKPNKHFIGFVIAGLLKFCQRRKDS